MPAPRFQNGLTDVFGAPGVYIKELAPSAPVRGLFLGITGVTGECVRGPVGRYVEIRSMQRFVDVYGGRDKGINGGAVIGKIWAELQGKSFGTLYVVRAAAAAAVAASFTLEDTAGGAGALIVRVDATSPGTWGNDVMVKVSPASDGISTHWNLTVKLYGKVYPFQNIDTSGSNDNTAFIIGNDDANPVILTKLASGRPVNNAAGVDGADTDGFIKLGQTVSGFTSVAGTDGAIADTDFTGAGKTMEVLNGTRGVGHAFVAGRSNAAIKTKILALGAVANDRLWLACPDSETVTISSAATEVATLRDKHVVYVFNHSYITDPVTGLQVVEQPTSRMASILSQTEPDMHPGIVETADLNKEVIRTQFEMSDADRDTADAAGITFFNRDLDQSGNQVFLFGNGRTTDLAVNNSQINGQRSKFFLVAGLAQRARGDQNKPNTPDIRAARKAGYEGWLTELAISAKRFVAVDEATLTPQFEVKNDLQVNTQNDIDAGIQRDLVRVKLIPTNLYLQLNVEIGTTVKIAEQQ